MIVIALFVAGLTAAVLGLFGSPGLLAVGLLWLGVAYLGRRHGQRLKATAIADIGVSTVLRGAALFLVGGLVALLVGLNQWGIDAPDLRWLPIVGGGVLTVFAVVTSALLLLGSGLEASAGEAPTVPATVTIVTAVETGTFINERPRIEFVLDVTPEGQATYRVTKKATVPFTALGSINPGDGFRALVVGPEDPEQMTIDWAATIRGS